MGNEQSGPGGRKTHHTQTDHIEMSPRDLKMFCGSPGSSWCGHVTYCDFLITNRSGKRLSYQVVLSDKLDTLVVGTNHTYGCLLPDQSKTIRLEFSNKPDNIREWMRRGDKTWVAVASKGDDFIKQEDVRSYYQAHINNTPEGYVEAALSFVFRDPPFKLDNDPDTNCPRTERWAKKKKAEQEAKEKKTKKKGSGTRRKVSATKPTSVIMLPSGQLAAYDPTMQPQPQMAVVQDRNSFGASYQSQQQSSQMTALLMYPTPQQPNQQRSIIMTAMPKNPSVQMMPQQPSSQDYAASSMFGGGMGMPQMQLQQSPRAREMDKSYFTSSNGSPSPPPPAPTGQMKTATPPSPARAPVNADNEYISVLTLQQRWGSPVKVQPPSSGSDSSKGAKLAEQPGEPAPAK